MRSHALAATALFALVDASSLTPPVLPLIVRNPYLSAWLPGARQEPWKMWPRFWEGGDLGFSILAQIPDTHEVYPLLGRPQDFLDKRDTTISIKEPHYKGASYDASTTNLTYTIPAPRDSKQAGLDLVLSFLSPITPTSTARQTIPAAYLKIYVQGTFDLNLYLDVNGQWVSGKRDSELQWDFVQQEPKDSVPGLKTWKVKRREEQLFTETNDQSEWGQLHFTGPADARHESGKSWELRQRFARTGTLQNQIDRKFRRIFEDEPIFAFSKRFNLTTSNRSSALFTFAHIQDPVTQYASARGLTFMRPLWESFYPGGDDNLIQVHYGDFENTKFLASNYSEQLRIDAYKSGSHNYVDIVALSARQVMGATSFSGTPENPLLFLKEISSNGNTQTVDVIFPAFPFFLYTQPKWGAYLLEPLLEHQLSGQYPNKYSMHDLGYHFPNFTGHSDGNDEYMPLEECGDMLIMALALINSFIFDSAETAQSVWSTAGTKPAPLSSEENVFALTNLGTVDGISHIDEHWRTGAEGVKAGKQWASRSYDLLLQWTSYLEEFSLEPHNQLSTDDFAGWLPYMTNLALKGIIGIKAFSEIATLLDKPDVAKNYRNISDTYITKWEEFGTSPDGTHAKISYHWYGSWTTLYSLYADALLCFHPSITNPTSDANPFASTPGSATQQPLDSSASSSNTKDFIPHHVYRKQSDWYSLVLQRYGLPLDSRHLYTKSDWQFQAAAVSSPKTRKQILDRVALWVNETSTDLPFTDLFETEGDGGFGSGIRFTARPVVGGHFAFLALERSCGGKFGAGKWQESGEGDKKVMMEEADEL
ncbi:glutaminase A [Periconia macrospinosa]|uniref:Glutaminase A n=1 Tax=Periconia macrospinosa TaxID=97972 RepID=A0A2V1E154_9PLEO|nr:glutaminase A [Periconia macrospinosa]